MTHLTIAEYREMVKDIIDFKNENGQMPEFASVKNKEISHEHYSAMINNVNNYILEHGRSPELVQIR
ncbi:MAG: pseudomurein-binding protein [Methanobrevibacter sp.]|nr:pseudomurein-binding protein [Methanobrevibacter sp.]